MKIIKNYLYNIGSGVLVSLMPFITTPYIARVIGKEFTGVHSYTFSISQYFLMIALLGTLTYGNRSIAYVKDDINNRSKTFKEIFFMNIINISLLTILYLLCVFILFDKNIRNFYLIQSIYLISAFFDISWFYMGMEQFKKIVVRNIIIKIIGTMLIFIYVRSVNDIYYYCLVLSLSNLIGNISLWKDLNRYIVKTKIKRKDIFIHYKGSVKLFLPRIAVQVYTLLDKVMLGAMVSKSAVGVYELTINVTKMPLPLITSLGTVIMPRIANLYHKNNIEEIKKYLYKTFNFQTYLGVLLSFGMLGISEMFIFWYFGEGYSESILLMEMLAFTTIGISWSNVIGLQLMIPMKREKEYTISLFSGAIINLIFNLIFIKKLGAIGAAIGTVLAEITVSFVQLYFVKNFIEIRQLFKDFHKCLISGIMMFLVIKVMSYYLTFTIINTFIVTIIGILIYLLLTYFLKVNIVYEWGIYIKNIIKRKRNL